MTVLFTAKVKTETEYALWMRGDDGAKICYGQVTDGEHSSIQHSLYANSAAICDLKLIWARLIGQITENSLSDGAACAPHISINAVQEQYVC